MTRHLITISLLCLLLFVVSIPKFISSKILGIATLNPADILSLVNLKRQESGITPLKPDDKLMVAAHAKAQDMVEKGYWAHYEKSGLKPWDFIEASGYNYQHAGENLARGYTDPKILVESWLNSPGHKANLLGSNYTQTGIAVVPIEVNGRDSYLVVQLFATPAHGPVGTTKYDTPGILVADPLLFLLIKLGYPVTMFILGIVLLLFLLKQKVKIRRRKKLVIASKLWQT